MQADHLAVITLSVGRAKDYARILGLLEPGSATTRRHRRVGGAVWPVGCLATLSGEIPE
jgi:hypothetical protein